MSYFISRQSPRSAYRSMGQMPTLLAAIATTALVSMSRADNTPPQASFFASYRQAG